MAENDLIMKEDVQMDYDVIKERLQPGALAQSTGDAGNHIPVKEEWIDVVKFESIIEDVRQSGLVKPLENTFHVKEEPGEIIKTGTNGGIFTAASDQSNGDAGHYIPVKEKLNDDVKFESSIEDNLQSGLEKLLDDTCHVKEEPCDTTVTGDLVQSFGDPGSNVPVKEEWIDDVEIESLLEDLHQTRLDNSLDDTWRVDKEPGDIKMTGAHSFPVNIYSGNDPGSGSPAKNRASSKRKSYSCIFCKKTVKSLPKHLDRVHNAEERVRELLSLPKGSQRRREVIRQFRGEGALACNTLGPFNRGGSIVSWSSYLPCLNCRNFLKKENMRKHYMKCAKKKGPPDLISKCRSLLVCSRAHPVEMSAELRDIIAVMADDQKLNIIQTDATLITFGNWLVKTAPEIDLQKTRIRRTLADICSVLLHMYDHDEDHGKLLLVSYYYTPAKFDLFINAVLHIIGYKDGQYRAPSVATSLGRSWMKCGKIQGDIFQDCNNQVAKSQVDGWMEKYQSYFYQAIEKPATLYSHERRWDANNEIPTNEDVKSLNVFLLNTIHEQCTILNEEFSLDTWKELSSAVLVYLTIFNRKRSGEVQRALMENYRQRTSFNSIEGDWKEQLSLSDVQVACRFSRFLVRGLSVLVEDFIEEAIQLIVKFRRQAGVGERNIFLFGLDCSRHVDCQVSLRRFVEQCKAKNPRLLTTTKLKKHLSSSLHLLKLSENDSSILTQFLGYIQKPHELPQLQLPIEVEEMVHVAPILAASLTGTLDTLRGRDFATINRLALSSPASLGDSDYLRSAASSMGSVGPSCALQPRVNLSTDSEEEMSSREISPPHQTPMKRYQPQNQSVFKRGPEGSSRSNEKILTEHTPTKRSQPRRMRWTPEQRRVIENYFSENLDNRTLPTVQAVKRCLKENGDVLGKRTQAQVRSFMSNVNLGKRKR